MTPINQDINHQKQHSAVLSLYASGGLVILKIFAAILSGSLALLLESAHSLVDLCSTIMTWFAIKESAKPADDEHHYGHGKIEAVAALIQMGLLIGLAMIVAFEALKQLYFKKIVPIEASSIAIIVLCLSICVDFIRWRHLRATAIQTKSEALAADSLHFSTDILNSMAVICGIIAVNLGLPSADNLAALGVCCIITITALKLGRNTINTLLDAAPEGAANTIRQALNTVAGIAHINAIKVRSVGHELICDIQISVSRIFSLERVVAVKLEAQRAISLVLPEAQCTITADPFAYDNETILERVLLIAAKRRVPVHHVTVQELEGQLSISLDIEVDGRLSLSAAHQIASKLEVAIRDEFGADTEVETHIEPLEAQGLLGRDAPTKVSAHISSVIYQIEEEIPSIGNVHSIRVRQTERGLVVSLHVLAEADLSVEMVHEAVDKLERRVRKACPEVVRIVSHAEPR